jgi:DNA polymerase-3 subunit alpha
MGDVLKKIKPLQFEDLSAILALYRPGPMRLGQLDDFIKRKCGKQEIPYPHPKLKEVLESTYGIILYQEQIMQIISIIAGFSMAQADDLRKVLMCKETTPKSKANKMRSAFIEGCAKTHQIPERQANQLFDLLDFLAGYTFNKAHAVAYALITYRTAYLKANFPIEFMTAVKTKGAL